MPYLYKAIGWIAKGLPIIMKWSQKIFDWVVEGIKWLFTDMPTMVGDWIKKIPGYLTNIGSWIWEKIQNFFSFQWLRNAIANIIGFIGNILIGLNNVWGIDGKLDGAIARIKGTEERIRNSGAPRGKTLPTTQIEIHLKSDTNPNMETFKIGNDNEHLDERKKETFIGNFVNSISKFGMN